MLLTMKNFGIMLLKKYDCDDLIKLIACNTIEEIKNITKNNNYINIYNIKCLVQDQIVYSSVCCLCPPIVNRLEWLEA